MLPTMHKVTSSNVESVGHCGKHLYVEFKGGSTYRYKDVPADHLDGLRNTDSVGKYLHAHIKSGPFAYERL